MLKSIYIYNLTYNNLESVYNDEYMVFYISNHLSQGVVQGVSLNIIRLNQYINLYICC